MKKIITISLFLIITASLFAQKQTAHWYFGNKAALNFNFGDPIALNDSQMITNEGCSTISDFDGDLLFYTDGVTVWNKNHNIMLNGQNLNGNNSSTNSAIIIPKPDNIDSYYIFTVDHLGFSNGLQYTEVDMNLDNSLGGITSKNNLLYEPSTEKITAVRHQNDKDWWVLSHKWNSNEFVAHKITSSGIDAGIISPAGINVSGISSNTIGAMKFSPNGKKIAIVHSYDNNVVQIFDFNDITGAVSNEITLNGFNGDPRGVYGIEFSPDSSLIYTTDSGGTIYQFNISLSSQVDIQNSRFEIANSINKLGAIQLGPNGKIYITRDNADFLGKIGNPNIIGANSNFILNGVFLDRGSSTYGLPPFIQSYFWSAITVENACFEEVTNFTLTNPDIDQIWNFNDPASGTSNTSTEVNPTHTFSSPGDYSVEVITTNSLGQLSQPTRINITISENPVANKPPDYILCDNNFDNDNRNGIIQSFLLSSWDSNILLNQNSRKYEVFYYEDSNYTNRIDKNVDYENIIQDRQTIYAKIVNRGNYKCFDTTEFDLVINDLPFIEIEEEFVVCSNILPAELSVQNDLGIYTYEWRLEDGTLYSDSNSITFSNVDFIPAEGLLFNLTATNPNTLCETTKSVLVRRFDFSPFTLDDISITDLSENNTIQINRNESSYNLDEYVFGINNPYNDIIQYQNEPIFYNVIPGIRKLYIKDIYDCQEFEFEIPIVGFQKFFTPNNDGYNDTWQILGINENFYNTSIIMIYDRFGKIIANLDPRSRGWNGYYNGVQLPASDYWFTVKLIDQDGNIRDKKGHFSLIRR